jgi:protein-S-isoprenylcysteine O-methyltransferase Ste14
MTEQNQDHAQVMAPPPLVFLGYMIGALIVNWALPFSAPSLFILKGIEWLAVAAGTLWGLLASPFLFWTIIHAVIHAEEVYLDGKFGEEYKAYRSRVRQWI